METEQRGAMAGISQNQPSGALAGSTAFAGLLPLAVFILGPLLSMALWAFAGAWYYPNLTPQQVVVQVVDLGLTHTNMGRCDQAEPGGGDAGDLGLGA